jgi:hypothetical protein
VSILIGDVVGSWLGIGEVYIASSTWTSSQSCDRADKNSSGADFDPVNDLV